MPRFQVVCRQGQYPTVQSKRIRPATIYVSVSNFVKIIQLVQEWNKVS